MGPELRRPWRKRGLVAIEPPASSWRHSHAALPVVELTDADQPTVYFCARDEAGRSRIARGALSLEQPVARLAVESQPVLDLGSMGAFDESGVTTSCVVADGSHRFLYYTGWSRGVTVPFYFYAGLAISEDGGRSFARHSRAPVLERDATDPYLTASPWVLIDNGRWRMWYVSCVRWEVGESGPRHYYHIRHAESRDGITWRRTGHVCIDFATSAEHAFGRPCVRRGDDGIYRMWYSYRGASYRIGYAESRDGLAWTRHDAAAGIDVSPDGWDSEMIEYPAVFAWHGRDLMLYNGNDYGRTGLGLAEAALLA